MNLQHPVSSEQIELMAPAGSYSALSAAIRAGADSVYFGVNKLNMRARSASPFGVADLKRIARICRRCGVRSYLTLNTIVYDEELDLMREILVAAGDAGISAVIASDIAAISCARELRLEVHISVQANVSNIGALTYYAQYADTVVPARELTLEQIRGMADAIAANDIRGPSGQRLRLELFAHGALCVAICGTCGMSLAVYNSSANRGACFQTCRRRYRVTDEETGDEFVVDNKFIMSPSDICTIRFLDRLIDAGVSVLKLEGRSRPADYVATVTRVYRQGLQALSNGNYGEDAAFDRWEEELKSVFHRGFWHGAYYCGRKLGEWSKRGHSLCEEMREQQGLVTNYFAKPGIMEFELWQQRLDIGEKLLVEGPTTGSLRLDIGEMRVNDQPVDYAVRGDRVTVATPAKVRRNDKVFALRKRNRMTHSQP